MISWFKKKRIYLDHASTTPIGGEVLCAMNSVYKNNYFNPSALYAEGVLAAQKISDARKSAAKLLGTTSDHIIFSRGGTESVNMAVAGVIGQYGNSRNDPSVLASLRQLPLGRGASAPLPHVIVSEIEHASVLETAKDLERKGIIQLSLAPVTNEGIVDVDELKKFLKPETILVSVMYANNEIGTVQPIREIAKLLRWHKKQAQGIRHKAQAEQENASALRLTPSAYPLFHTDAIQAANYLELNVEKLGVDLLSLSGSKIYGPKSSGVLFVRDMKLIAPILHGGEQESGLRAGTEDVAQIVGFAKALEIAREQMEKENTRLAELQNYFFDELKKEIPNLIVNGAVPPPLEGVRGCVRIPNNINISIPNISGERIIVELDARGICASSKSACREDADEESHVIAAIRRASATRLTATAGSVRFTMGRNTTKKEVRKTVFELSEIVKKIRSF